MSNLLLRLVGDTEMQNVLTQQAIAYVADLAAEDLSSHCCCWR
jgi:hypothetical protein